MTALLVACTVCDAALTIGLVRCRRALNQATNQGEQS